MTRTDNKIANKHGDEWATIMVNGITIGICMMAPRVAYEVLYRLENPEIQNAINDQTTRAILFLYITIGTVFTASFSSFMGSFPLMVNGNKITARRIIGTVQCIASLLIIFLFYILGPTSHEINLEPFTTRTQQFVYYVPNHYLSYFRFLLAFLGAASAIVSAWDKIMARVEMIKGHFKR